MRNKETLDSTSNNKIYKAMLKKYRALKGIISCSICGYHKNENKTHKEQRNWKKLRKDKYI